MTTGAPAWRAAGVAVAGAALLGTWVVVATRVPGAAQSPGWYVAAAMVPCVLVSALLVARLPGAALTRLVAIGTLCQVFLLADDALARWQAAQDGLAYDHAGSGTDLFGLVWLGTLPLLPLLLTVFPDGVPNRGSWRWVWTAQLAAVALLAVVILLQAAGVDAPWLLGLAAGGGVVLTVSGVVRGGWLVGMWWRSRGARRRQLLPFVVVAGAIAAYYAGQGLYLILAGHGSSSDGALGGVLAAVTVAGLPVALGFSVLRHRLFGIEVTVNRVIVAGAVAAMLFGTYTATITAAAALSGDPLGDGGGWDWRPLLAAGVTVITLSPLYRLAQASVDRMMFGERDRPDRALRHLAGRLGDTVDPLEVPDVVVGAVAFALRLPFVALDRDAGTETVRAAVRGSSPEPGRIVEFPICYAGERLAVLSAAPRAGESRLSTADRALLRDLAAQAGPALYSGRLVTELADSRERLRQGRLEERARLRRALHDGLSPSLSGIAIAAAAARGRKPTDPTVVRLMARIEREADAGAATLRALLAGLRPPGLGELGLTVAIETRAGELTETTGVMFAVDADVPLPALAPAVEQTAYLVTVEAMVNVVRHAEATRCTVSLIDHGDALGVRVCDDGHGLAPEFRDGDGIGSARERVVACGGTFSLATAPEGGARLDARLPAWDGV